jgi:hypothetical protein
MLTSSIGLWRSIRRGVEVVMDQWIICSVSGERLLSVVDIAGNGVVCTGGRRGGTTDAPILCCSDPLLLQSSASPTYLIFCPDSIASPSLGFPAKRSAVPPPWRTSIDHRPRLRLPGYYPQLISEHAALRDYTAPPRCSLLNDELLRGATPSTNGLTTSRGRGDEVDIR